MSNPPSYKCILLGDSYVGKSDLRYQIVKEKFDQERKEISEPAFYVKDCNVNEKSFKIHLWEFMKNGEWKSLMDYYYYYREAVLAILVYDITRRETFENIARWRDEVRERGSEEVSFIVVGNKSDLEREYALYWVLCREIDGKYNRRRVEYEEGEKFAKENKMEFFETSTKSGENVKEVSEEISKEEEEKFWE